MNSTQHLVSFTSMNYSLRSYFKVCKRARFLLTHVECSEHSIEYTIFFRRFSVQFIRIEIIRLKRSFTWFEKDQPCDLHVLIGGWNLFFRHSHSSCQKQLANHRKARIFSMNPLTFSEEDVENFSVLTSSIADWIFSTSISPSHSTQNNPLDSTRVELLTILLAFTLTLSTLQLWIKTIIYACSSRLYQVERFILFSFFNWSFCTDRSGIHFNQ